MNSLKITIKGKWVVVAVNHAGKEWFCEIKKKEVTSDIIILDNKIAYYNKNTLCFSSEFGMYEWVDSVEKLGSLWIKEMSDDLIKLKNIIPAKLWHKAKKHAKGVGRPLYSSEVIQYLRSIESQD